MSKSSKFEQVGITSDNKPVFSGVYSLFETHGIPLDQIVSMLTIKNIVVSWMHLYDDCLLSGMSHSRTISKIVSAAEDAGFNSEYIARITSNIEDHFSGRKIYW